MYAEARKLFERAYQLAPEKSDYFGNILESLLQEGNPAGVLDWSEKASPDLLKLHGIQECVARSYAAMGRFNQARDAYTHLFGSGYRDDDILRQAVDFLLANNGKADALKLVQTYRKGGANQSIDLMLAKVHRRNEQYKEATALLEKLRTDAPDNLSILTDLTDIYALLKRHDEAISLLREALTKEPKSALLLYNIGYQLADVSKYEEAREMLEAAIEVSPKDENIQEELAYVRSRLGRGHDREIRSPLTPVALPPGVTMPVDYDRSSIPPESDRYSLFQFTSYQFTPGTPITRTVYNDILLLADRAVESLSTLQFSFTPLSERIFLNQLEVLDAGGKVISTAKEKDLYVTDVEGGEANGKKLLCIPVPGLATGCRVRYSITYKDRSSSDKFPFDSTFFVSRYGTLLSGVSIRGDTASCAAATRGEIEFNSGPDYKTWLVKNLPALPNENATAMLERFNPILYLGSISSDWTKIGDTYLADIAEQLKADPDIESLARDLVAGMTDEEAKINILYRWIQNEFVYKAIEFGTRARIPNRAGLTCTNRYGDCKDLSILLHHMLRAVGISSQPCLVNTENLIAGELPSLDQFNHMIVHLPATGKRPACWLDPTDRYHSLITAPSGWLENQETFILEKGSSKFVTVPLLPYPAPHKVQILRRLKAVEGNSLLIAETLTTQGSPADGMRSYIASISAAERLQRFRELISGLDPALTLDTLEIKNLKEQDLPLIVELTLTAANQLDAAGKLKQLPTEWERDYLRPVAQQKRVTPFGKINVWNLESVTTGEFPLAEAAKSWKSASESWGSCRIDASAEGNQWRVAYSSTSRRGEIYPASQYADYFKFWDEGLSRLAQPWQAVEP